MPVDLALVALLLACSSPFQTNCADCKASIAEMCECGSEGHCDVLTDDAEVEASCCNEELTGDLTECEAEVKAWERDCLVREQCGEPHGLAPEYHGECNLAALDRYEECDDAG